MVSPNDAVGAGSELGREEEISSEWRTEFIAI